MAARRAEEEVTRLRASATSDEIDAAYSLLFERTFRELAVLLGPRGSVAVVERALRRARRLNPLLLNAMANESGVQLGGVRKSCRNPNELKDAVGLLFSMSMDVLASLIGADLLEPVLERMVNGPYFGGRRWP